ncbi:MAG TPA: glycosyltransferase [Candidatus Magasanikbacteria bacterium]|nr:glycosyltransferase [Candidatus Magasanikbacteria bacterium]
MRSLTLYIPLYDAAEYLENSIKSLGEFFLANVVFVDDGSRDSTLEILAKSLTGVKFSYQIVRIKKNSGKGSALKQAMGEMVPQTEFVAFTDGELPYGLDVLRDALNLAVEKQADLVVGERVSRVGQYTRYRGVASKLFRIFLPRKLRFVNDTQCGLKLFRRDVAEKIFTHLKTDRWVFDAEIFLLAIENNFSIVRIPVNVRPELVRNGRLRFFSNGFQILFDLFRVRYYDKKGDYKIS